MDIEGPLKIGVLDKGDGTGWELHIDFRDDFRGLDLATRGQAFRDYLVSLNADIVNLPDDDRNRSGMLIVQQLCEQLLPHIEADEIPLSETLVVEIQQTPGIDLSSLLGTPAQ